MKAAKQNKLLSALLTTILGVMFLIWKGGVVSIAMTVLGVALIVSAILDILHSKIVPCVVKAVIGAVIIVFGWAFVTVALYIMAAVLLIYGILQVVEFVQRNKKRKLRPSTVLICLAQPIVSIVVAACLLFNQGGTISWVFIIAGIFLIVDGVLALADCLSSK